MYLPYKKPIITCKIGEPYNVLGGEGCYFEPSSSLSLAEAMIHLIESGVAAINVEPLKHEWKHRTAEFDKWVKNTFVTDDKNL